MRSGESQRPSAYDSASPRLPLSRARQVRGVVDVDRRVRSAAAELGPPVALDDGEAPFAHAREHAEHQPPQWGLTPFARSTIAWP